MDLNAVTKATIKTLESSAWWKYVQPEVSQQIHFIIEHISIVGVDFKNAFISAFKFQHAARVLKKQSVRADSPGALFGRAMTDECYQSGALPAKLLLGLDDWIRPNDADVQACMHLCQQIEILDKYGLLKTKNEINDSTPTDALGKIINWSFGQD